MERLAIFGGIVLLLMVGFLLFQRWQVRRVARMARTDPLLSGLEPGTPAIVYFTSPFCAPCQTRQMPALKALQSDLGAAVQIIEVNAVEQAEAASRWGVFSVPTTFVLDSFGQPHDVNYGVADAHKLKEQLAKVA